MDREPKPRRNIRVQDVMRPAVSVRPETTAREVLKVLRDNNIPGVPVVNEAGELEGFVTDGHLMDSALPRYMKMMGNLSFVSDDADEWVHYLTDAADKPVRDVMTREVSQVPILMLTAHDTTLDKVRALDLGADDYLTKPFDHLELFARLRAMLRRPTSRPAATGPDFACAELSLVYATQEVRLNGAMLRLTTIEYRLLEELVRHAGFVLPHHVLLERVWGPDYVDDVQYLKVFVRRLRRKLGDTADHPRFIHTEWGIGYRFAAPR